MLTCQKDRFDIPAGLTYLNCAYMGPLSHEVIEAGRTGLERKARPWTVAPNDFFVGVEEARELFGRVLGADPDGVALLPAASYGIATAAQNLDVDEGKHIVVLAEEFPSNFYTWQDLASRTGGVLVTVARPNSLDWTTALLEHIDERTAVVAIPNCHWTDGGMVDLVAVGARVREVGAALVIDGTQSIGALPFDVGRIRPDFVIASAYKWLLGPYSAAFMWVAPEHRDGRPLEFNWIARRGSEDFPKLVEYETAFRPGARRYDVGETSNFALMPAINAALRQNLRWGVDAISSYVGALTDKLAASASEFGLSVAPAGLRSPHLVGVRLPGANAEAIAAAMASAQVHVSVRGNAMRVSPHAYNDAEDIDRLIDVLRSSL